MTAPLPVVWRSEDGGFVVRLEFLPPDPKPPVPPDPKPQR